MYILLGLNLRQAESVPDHFYSSLLSLSWTNEAVDIIHFCAALTSHSRANKKRQFHFLSTRSSTFAPAVSFLHPHEFAGAQKCIWFKCREMKQRARAARCGMGDFCAAELVASPLLRPRAVRPLRTADGSRSRRSGSTPPAAAAQLNSVRTITHHEDYYKKW